MSENVTVIDNFLFEEYFRDLHNIMMGNEFPWYYNDFITYDPAITPDLAESSESMFQYIHIFYKTQPTDSFYLICPLLECLNARVVYRLKANQNPVDGGKQLGDYHVDTDIENTLTSILYINTNDGYTKFEDGTIVESVENRLVTFDSRMKHVGFGCKKYKRRVLININYAL